jgi:hypothetical protein
VLPGDWKKKVSGDESDFAMLTSPRMMTESQQNTEVRRKSIQSVKMKDEWEKR